MGADFGVNGLDICAVAVIFSGMAIPASADLTWRSVVCTLVQAFGSWLRLAKSSAQVEVEFSVG
jgi:hypothetical protein